MLVELKVFDLLNLIKGSKPKDGRRDDMVRFKYAGFNDSDGFTWNIERIKKVFFNEFDLFEFYTHNCMNPEYVEQTKKKV